MRQGKIILREMQKENGIYHASLVFSIELERNKYKFTKICDLLIIKVELLTENFNIL